MFLFALSAQLSLPTVTNERVHDVRAIFGSDDFPAFLLNEGATAFVVYTRTTVRPDGTTQGCVAETSSGNAKLDEYTCQLIVRRAKFLPARWDDGSAAYGVIRFPVRWMTRPGPVPTALDDLDLSVNQLPKGADLPVGVSLQVAADEKGHVVSCTERPLALNTHEKHFPELVALACQQATASLVLTPPVDASGKPVRSIQSVSVDFKVGK